MWRGNVHQKVLNSEEPIQNAAGKRTDDNRNGCNGKVRVHRRNIIKGMQKVSFIKYLRIFLSHRNSPHVNLRCLMTDTENTKCFCQKLNLFVLSLSVNK